MSDRKRSRFDVDEPRRSRFDERDPRRRSRSPTDKDQEPRRRSRSPLSSSKASPAAADPEKAAFAAKLAEKARATAAKIAADIEAKKKAGLLPTTTAPKLPLKLESKPSEESASQSQDIYEQDGDFIKDIEVNDLRNRYTLTKGPTQKMIMEKTGADVTTRGAYYPDKSMATAANPPLYLHITSRTKEGLQKALDIIDEMMNQELPNLIDERRFPRRREQEVERDERGRRKWPEEKIPIQLEPISGFNLRAQVVGQQGMYVKHIQQESGGARVQIKGRGSGYYEQDTGEESDEPMYLHVAAPQQSQVDTAKQLCLDLLENVEREYNEFKERGGHRRGGFGGRDGDRDGGRGQRDGGYGGRDGGYGNRDGAYADQAQYAGYGANVGYNSPAAAQQYGAQYAQAQAAPYSEQDLNGWLQYYQWEWTDPAGFGKYMQENPAVYESYNTAKPWVVQHSQMLTAAAAAPGYEAAAPGYDQAPGYSGTPTSYANSAAPPPPPPPGEEPAPPPPPSGYGGYNAMPPPPGL